MLEQNREAPVPYPSERGTLVRRGAAAAPARRIVHTRDAYRIGDVDGGAAQHVESGALVKIERMVDARVVLVIARDGKLAVTRAQFVEQRRQLAQTILQAIDEVARGNDDIGVESTQAIDQVAQAA